MNKENNLKTNPRIIDSLSILSRYRFQPKKLIGIGKDAVSFIAKKEEFIFSIKLLRFVIFFLPCIDKIGVTSFKKMIDINVKGLMYVTKAIVNNMIENSTGHIINIGSLAGREVYPKGNIYCASKYAVKAISESLRLDLNKHSIKVSEINPGLVETSFSDVRFKGDTQTAKNVYKGYEALQANDIAEIISFVISRPKHVNIADLVVLPSDQACSTLINNRL